MCVFVRVCVCLCMCVTCVYVCVCVHKRSQCLAVCVPSVLLHQGSASDTGAVSQSAQVDEPRPSKCLLGVKLPHVFAASSLLEKISVKSEVDDNLKSIRSVHDLSRTVWSSFAWLMAISAHHLQ